MVHPISRPNTAQYALESTHLGHQLPPHPYAAYEAFQRPNAPVLPSNLPHGHPQVSPQMFTCINIILESQYVGIIRQF